MTTRAALALILPLYVLLILGFIGVVYVVISN